MVYEAVQDYPKLKPSKIEFDLPQPNYTINTLVHLDENYGHPKITKVNAPIMEISSTFIRREHKKGKNVRPLLPCTVWKYMDEMNFYR